MNEMISYQDVQNKILEVRGERVLLDSKIHMHCSCYLFRPGSGGKYQDDTYLLYVFP